VIQNPPQVCFFLMWPQLTNCGYFLFFFFKKKKRKKKVTHSSLSLSQKSLILLSPTILTLLSPPTQPQLPAKQRRPPPFLLPLIKTKNTSSFSSPLLLLHTTNVPRHPHTFGFCCRHVAPQILIVLFLIYLFDNIIQLISLRSLWYYGGW
jgi:hypothetical protein